MAESDVKKDDKDGGATLFECPMFQNYQARATFLSDFFPDAFWFRKYLDSELNLLSCLPPSQRSGDDNYVMNLELPTLESPATWVLRGVALLTQEPNIS